MDISDITKLIGKFFPILIFLFWVLVTVFANARKKGPTGKPMPPAQRPSYGDRQNQPQKEESGNSQISEDLKRTLETIFGESSPVEEKIPQQENEPVNKEPEPDEMQTSKESAILEEQAALQKAFSEVQQKVENISVSAPMQAYESEKVEEDSELVLSHQELRKGIILSEILAPPVTMR